MLLAQDIRTLDRSPQQRLVSIAIVVGIHITALAAILMALSHTLTITPMSPDITVRVDPPKVHPPLPQRPDVTLVKPNTVVIPTPDIPPIQSEGPRTIVATGPVQAPGPANPSNIFIGAQAIMGTHSTPDYPPLDRRFGHEGNVLLKLAIDERGAVIDAQVERSSGYESLDQAAANWVKSRWRYHPATQAGDAVPSNAEVTVNFRLTTH